MSGVSASTTTVPRSPPVMLEEALLPLESFIVAPPAVVSIEETDRSLEAVSPEATVVEKTIPVEPEPLA